MRSVISLEAGEVAVIALCTPQFDRFDSARLISLYARTAQTPYNICSIKNELLHGHQRRESSWHSIEGRPYGECVWP